jgi:hypothetical protein
MTGPFRACINYHGNTNTEEGIEWETFGDWGGQGTLESDTFHFHFPNPHQAHAIVIGILVDVVGT